jgi:hypothetical protein
MTNAMSTAGGMNRAVAPTPIAISAGVASIGARKKPTLPPAANQLIAAALSPAASRAPLPAAGWNIAMPRPDTKIKASTSGYGPARPASPRPMPATATPAGANQSRRRRSTATPKNGCGIEAPSAAARVSPVAATYPYPRSRTK